MPLALKLNAYELSDVEKVFQNTCVVRLVPPVVGELVPAVAQPPVTADIVLPAARVVIIAIRTSPVKAPVGGLSESDVLPVPLSATLAARKATAAFAGFAMPTSSIMIAKKMIAV